MTPKESELWLRTKGLKPNVKLRLVCFSYAGGGASVYHKWHDALPEWEVRAVQLPARQDRLGEKGLTRVADIIPIVVEAIAALPHLPIAFYGHSFGALLAYETARALEAKGVSVEALAVGGRVAPTVMTTDTAIYTLSDDGLIEELKTRYGANVEIFKDPDLRELTLPSLRADFEALGTYVHLGQTRVKAKPLVMRGLMDKACTQEAALRWQEAFESPVHLFEVDAGHFFVDTHFKWIWSELEKELKQ